MLCEQFLKCNQCHTHTYISDWNLFHRSKYLKNVVATFIEIDIARESETEERETELVEKKEKNRKVNKKLKE